MAPLPMFSMYPSRKQVNAFPERDGFIFISEEPFWDNGFQKSNGIMCFTLFYSTGCLHADMWGCCCGNNVFSVAGAESLQLEDGQTVQLEDGTTAYIHAPKGQNQAAMTRLSFSSCLSLT